jgi:PAS domain S-box-containing protein
MPKRFEDLIAKLHVGVVVQGPSTELLLCNQAALDLLGLDEEQYRGRSSYDPEWNIIREDGTDFHADQRPMARVLATGQRVSNVVMGVYRPRTRDRVWVLVHADPELDADGKIVQIVATLVDITERKRLEASLLEARKLESIGRLAGGVAHDFNNLLSIITTATSLALTSPAGTSTNEELTMALDAAGRAADLTRQLLTFARQRPAMPAVLNPADVIVSVAALLGRVLGAHIEFLTRCAADTWSTRIDPSEMEQVLVNLTANARDAMPRGGSFRLETANVAIPPGHDGMPPGDYVRIIARDSGEGMSAETIDRIFEPFFTTKEQGRGTGLGLATVHGIVTNAGGHIRAESTIARGTTFTIHLPRAASVESVVAPPVVEMPRGHETVLLVEDESALRQLCARTLQGLGYTVLAAADGEAAVALEASYSKPIDLLFTDLLMPRMHGTDLAKRLVTRRAGLKVLFTSGLANAKSDELRRWPLLDKPYTPPALAAAVRRALDT